MFDTYQMSPDDLWEQVAELKRRGIPVPKELEDRLQIISPDGQYTEVSKDGGPPRNPFNQGGFFDPIDPAKAWGPPAKPYKVDISDTVKLPNVDTKGFGKGLSPDTKGVGKDAGKFTGFRGFGATDPSAPPPFAPTAPKLRELLPGKGKKEEISLQDAKRKLDEQARVAKDVEEFDPSQFVGPDKPQNYQLLQDLQDARPFVGPPEPYVAEATGGLNPSAPPPPPPASVREMVTQQATPASVSQAVQPDVRRQATAPPITDEMYSQVAERLPMPPRMTDEMNPVEDPGFFDTGGKLDSFFGALKGFSPNTPAGQALLAASLGMMGAQGTYGNFGQALGRGGLMGLQQFNEAKQQESLDAYKQKTLNAQERMAQQKNAIDALKVRSDMGEKAFNRVRSFMERLENMARSGRVEEAQAAYDANATAKAAIPGWVAGKDYTFDDLKTDFYLDNPDRLSEDLGGKKNESTMESILRRAAAGYRKEPLPPGESYPTQEEMMLLKRNNLLDGLIAAQVNQDFDSIGMTAEQRLARIKGLQSGNELPMPWLSEGQGAAPSAVSPDLKTKGQEFIAGFEQKNGRKPTPEELEAFLRSLYKGN